MEDQLAYLAPVAAAIDDAIDALDCLLIALVGTSPTPLPYAVEQTITHAASVLRHSRENI